MLTQIICYYCSTRKRVSITVSLGLHSRTVRLSRVTSDFVHVFILVDDWLAMRANGQSHLTVYDAVYLNVIEQTEAPTALFHFKFCRRG